MRILQVTNFFKPSWESGGPARVCYEISKELVKRGHEVSVYTTDGFKYRLNVPKNKPVIVDKIKTYYFRNLSNYLSRKLVLPIPYYLPFIARKEIKKFDIIHIHELRTPSAIIVAHYAKKYGRPYVLHGHGSISRSVSKIKIKKLFDIFFGARIIKNATKLLAVSEEEANHYKSFGAKKEKINVVYNGMDMEYFRNLPLKGHFKKKYKILGKMVLYLGRINKSKGLEPVIRAFSKLSEEMKDVTLVIVGSGDPRYKSKLEELAKLEGIFNKIIYTGYVEEASRISAYVDADLFVHTVLYMGGVGITPLEAIICGTPIIVTNECGEIIKKAGCGEIVEYGNIQELKEKIKMLLENPDKGKKMVKKGIDYINKNLVLDKVVTKIEEIYESCLDSD